MYSNFSDAYETKSKFSMDRGCHKLAINAYSSESFFVSRWMESYALGVCENRVLYIPVEKYSKFFEKIDKNIHIFKISNIFNTVSKFLNEQDAKSFERALFHKKFLEIFKIYTIFLNISKYLDDEDKSSFHAAVNPPWNPFFYSSPRVDWKLVSKKWIFSLEELQRFKNVICWENATISTHHLWIFRNFVNWKNICETRHFYGYELKLFSDFIDWKTLAQNQKISKKFRLNKCC
jgi:hypothetical protein